MNRAACLPGLLFVAFLSALVAYSPEVTEASGALFLIPIDIKPGSASNPVNVFSGGVLPVAIYGSDFDVLRIAVDSVVLENGDGDQVEYWHASFQDIDDDGNLDLLIKFSLGAVVSSLGLDQEQDRTVVNLILSGTLSGPFGCTFAGLDHVLIMNWKRRK